MRILNLYGTYFVEAFRKLGHEVLSLGTTDDCDVVLAETLSLRGLLELLASRGFTPDLVLWADTCKLPGVLGFEALPAVTIGYSIDQYCNPWHVPWSAAFDLFLVAQKDYLPHFQTHALQRPAEWLPLFCKPPRDTDLGLARDIPVGFVGTVTGSINAARKRFLDAFRRQHPLVTLQGDYVPVYNRCRIVLNQSAVGELNFRIFEAAACGAAVLTEMTGNGLRELFTPGESLLTYPRGDAVAAAAAARAALADGSWERVAAAGKRAVQARHTAAARAKHILARAAELQAAGAPARRLAALPAIRAELHKAWVFLATDMALPIGPAHRGFYAELAAKN